MNRANVIELLWKLAGDDNPEQAHVRADQLLLDYIDDPEITVAYEAVKKWYS